MKTLSIQDFLPYRNTTFHVAKADGRKLELVEVTDHSNAQLEQFSLIFACPALPWLPQGTYSLVHADGKEFTLFLVPIGPEGNTMRYESIFSRFVNSPAIAGEN